MSNYRQLVLNNDMILCGNHCYRDTCCEQSVWNSSEKSHRINTEQSVPAPRLKSSTDCYHDSTDRENTADQGASRQTLTHNCPSSPHTSDTLTTTRKGPRAMENRGRGINSKSRWAQVLTFTSCWINYFMCNKSHKKV